jgi:hypothetical protein
VLVVVAPSARAHGVADYDSLHACRHAMWTALIGDEGFTMVIGGDTAGRLLEVGHVISDDDVVVIVHAMPHPSEVPPHRPKVMTMAKTRRSVQDILDNAEALAKRFEQTDPDTLHWTPTEPLARVAEAVQTRAAAERELLDAIAAARQTGATWAVLGQTLGTSGEAVRQKYGRLPQQADGGVPAAPELPATKAKAVGSTRTRKSTAKSTIGGRRSAVKDAAGKVGQVPRG